MKTVFNDNLQQDRTHKNRPLISVIVPVYNAEQYLEQCINSILSQTYSNIEIILVNDGSTDNSLQVIESFNDPRIVLIDQENSGEVAARARGIAQASGDYIGFVDSDDVIHPSMYEHLLNILVDSDADVSTIEFVLFKDQIPEKKTNSKPKVSVLDRDSFMRIFFKIGSQKIVYQLVTRLYKKELLDNITFRQFPVGGDVLSSYMIMLGAQTIAVSDQTYYYYRQGSGITSEFNRKYFCLPEVWKCVYEYSEEKAPEYVEYAKLNCARINFTLLSELAVSGEYNNPEYKPYISAYLNNLKKEKSALLKSDIAISRKILIRMFCLNYHFTAALLSKLKGIRHQ